MSARGLRGGHGRGRGKGRGRGRGGKVTTWEWHNNYTPGPEVYDQLWHIRREPAAVTPFLPTQCPIGNAQTRILDRKQTEGDIQRNFYVVEVTYSSARNSSTSCVEDAGASRTETVHVDLSRILEYTSPDQLEQFENEQFRIEAEAEAVASRIEAEELARRRLEKNAREPGVGKGSRMFNGLGLEAHGRASGRPRGRGRGRGRGSWRGRGAWIINTQLHGDDLSEVFVDVESDDTLQRAEKGMQLVVAETESEEDDLDSESRAQTTVARSAFVTNSALPISPVQSHRRLSAIPIIQRARPTATKDYESDPELKDANHRSMFSAAMQLRIEDDTHRDSDNSSDTGSLQPSQHRSKRRRTESTASMQRVPPTTTTFPSETQRTCSHIAPCISETSAGSDASDESKPPKPPPAVYRNLQPYCADDEDFDSIHVEPPVAEPFVESQSEDEEGDTEEYAVEAIIKHHREADKTFYLVKWEGHENSHDWLPEEDVEGAAELIAEYNDKSRRKKGKQKLSQ